MLWKSKIIKKISLVGILLYGLHLFGCSDTILTTQTPSYRSSIAFTSNRDGNNDIFTMDTDGSNQINRTKNGGKSDQYNQPNWSSDGKKIAYYFFNRENWGDVYVLHLDSINSDGTAKKEKVTNSEYPFNCWDPSWSPDGKEIAVVSNKESIYENYYDIYLAKYPADSNNVKRLTNNILVDYGPDWSPDGKKIAFTSNRDGNNEIYCINRNGTGQVNLTNHPKWDRDPNYSPDGKKIAFTSNRDGNNEIYVMNSDGSNVRRLTYNDYYDGFPVWSPNGKEIAFMSDRDGGDSEICKMNSDGSNQINLTNNKYSDFDPSWSPLIEK